MGELLAVAVAWLACGYAGSRLCRRAWLIEFRLLGKTTWEFPWGFYYVSMATGPINLAVGLAFLVVAARNA